MDKTQTEGGDKEIRWISATEEEEWKRTERRKRRVKRWADALSETQLRGLMVTLVGNAIEYPPFNLDHAISFGNGRKRPCWSVSGEPLIKGQALYDE